MADNVDADGNVSIADEATATAKMPIEVTADDLADEEWGPLKDKTKKGKEKKGIEKLGVSIVDPPFPLMFRIPLQRVGL